MAVFSRVLATTRCSPKDLELNLKTRLQVNKRLFRLPNINKNIPDSHVASDEPRDRQLCALHLVEQELQRAHHLRA
jgi:hypothetical protein